MKTLVLVMAAAMVTLTACDDHAQRFNGGRTSWDQRDKLVAQCKREYGGGARANSACSCIVDRYLVDYPSGNTKPSASWATKVRRICGV